MRKPSSGTHLADDVGSPDDALGRVQPVRESVDGGVEVPPATLELGDVAIAGALVAHDEVAARVDPLGVDIHRLPVGADQSELGGAAVSDLEARKNLVLVVISLPWQG